MRLQFDPGLAHQRAAMDAVLGLFDGAEAQPGAPAPTTLPGVVANAAPCSDATLLHNMRAIQAQAGLDTDDALARPDADGDHSVEFSLEMETGTGKTYTYVRTILELAARHQLHKWLIIVPSVATREAVLSTLRDTREHFLTLLPEVPYRFWAYDGRPLRVRSFATATSTELGVLTIAAFNKITNRLRTEDDRFGGQTPLAWVAHTRPCVILDEPHHYDSPLSKRSLSRLRPLFALRYGATHRRPRALIHRLSAAAAADRGLVKRVQVASVPATDDATARLSAQIHETVRLHVQRQALLAPRGIKVLSLLFVDRVASYCAPDGLVRTLFDKHFEALKGGCEALAALPAEHVRAAYFATKRRRGAPVAEAVETSGDSAADESAYQLIMRDKARLLSREEPVAFVFSHSALREGWDNPNIFQVCTLAPRTSRIRRRQEIGRGVRLCVDEHGRRVGDPEVDVLTVVPAEPYEDFVAAWEAEHDGGAEPKQRAPMPARAGDKPRSTAPVCASDTPWVEIDSDALIQTAGRYLAQADAGQEAHEPAPQSEVVGLAAVLLARMRPTIALTPTTIAAVVAAAPAAVRAPTAVANALAAALADQGG